MVHKVHSLQQTDPPPKDLIWLYVLCLLKLLHVTQNLTSFLSSFSSMSFLQLPVEPARPNTNTWALKTTSLLSIIGSLYIQMGIQIWNQGKVARCLLIECIANARGETKPSSVAIYLSHRVSLSRVRGWGKGGPCSWQEGLISRWCGRGRGGPCRFQCYHRWYVPKRLTSGKLFGLSWRRLSSRTTAWQQQYSNRWNTASQYIIHFDAPKPLPVSLANPLKLVGYETGKEWAHTSIRNKGLGHASQPNINVGWCAVKL